MTTIDSVGQFLEVQLEAASHRNMLSSNAVTRPVVAVTRQPGCNGESIARTLATDLGLVLYDWEIIEQVASNANVSEQVVALLGEKLRSELDDWLAGLEGSSGMSSYRFAQHLRAVLFTVASTGNALILGRGANFLLPPEKKSLGLSLIAPLGVRTEAIMGSLCLSHDKALKHITVAEREQRLWVKKYGHANIDDPIHYHLVVNTALVPPQTIVQLARTLLTTANSGDGHT